MEHMQEKEKYRVLTMLTCHNRQETTERCLWTLSGQNTKCEFTFIVVDDGSTDGTMEMLVEQKKELDIHILKGNGALFYSRGMHRGMKYALDNSMYDYDYYLLVNDDVDFFAEAISKLIFQSKEQNGAVVVGTTIDNEGHTSYGAIVFVKNVQHRIMEIYEWREIADAFNANCVLIPNKIFAKAGIMDSHYIHAMGDYDYGMQIKRQGGIIYPSKEYVGVCNRNSTKGLWSDTSLSRIERFKRKETIKGLPYKQWFYYLKKNFGLKYAIFYSLVPYVNIILGR